MSLLELNFIVREDPWGMTANSSVIGELFLNAKHPMWNKQVGEAWLGTHIQRPAVVTGRNENLLELIRKEANAILGDKLLAASGAELPFLFKILTINSPLSIQVHPNLKKAIELSNRFPQKYKDQTEKPEIGVAITETKLLLGFRPIEQILSFILSFDSAKKFFESEINNPSIKSIYKRLLTAKESEVSSLNSEINKLISLKTNCSEEEAIFLNLYSLYPNDSGVFQIFLLNLVTLNPGQGVFIPPDTVHAYLSGQLLECMATSDFVIRAGLTNKERDIPSLLEVIDYETFKIEKLVPNSALYEFSPYVIPTKQFRLEKFTGRAAQEVVIRDSPAIYFCLRGTGQISSDGLNVSFKAGSSCLVYSNAKHLLAVDGEFYRILINSAS